MADFFQNLGTAWTLLFLCAIGIVANKVGQIRRKTIDRKGWTVLLIFSAIIILFVIYHLKG